MLIAAVVFASAVAANISPLGVEVVSRDGTRRLVHVADADATPVQVCARKLEPLEGDKPVCGDVVRDRNGMRAHVDVDDRGDHAWDLVVTRFDARDGAPAALAGGLGVATALTVIGATTATVIAFTYPTDPIAAATLVEPADGRSDLGPRSGELALVLWAAAGVGAIGTGIATFVAVVDAEARHGERE